MSGRGSERVHRPTTDEHGDRTVFYCLLGDASEEQVWEVRGALELDGYELREVDEGKFRIVLPPESERAENRRG